MNNSEKIISAIEKAKKQSKEYAQDTIIVPFKEADMIIALLKKQEARELTINEWREWKANPKRNPICELWENDTSPMWILNPNDVHEPALLMGKLKLFTGKPTFEQCKEVKWNANQQCQGNHEVEQREDR